MNQFFQDNTILLDKNGATICDEVYNPKKVLSVKNALELLLKEYKSFDHVIPELDLNSTFNVKYYNQDKDIITVILEYSPRPWNIPGYRETYQFNLPWLYISAKYRINKETGKINLYRYVKSESNEHDKFLPETYRSADYGNKDYLYGKKNINVKIGISPESIKSMNDVIYPSFLPNSFVDLHICWPGNASIKDPVTINKDLILSTHQLIIKCISKDLGSGIFTAGIPNNKYIDIMKGYRYNSIDSSVYHDNYQKYLDSKEYILPIPVGHLL